MEASIAVQVKAWKVKISLRRLEVSVMLRKIHPDRTILRKRAFGIVDQSEDHRKKRKAIAPATIAEPINKNVIVHLSRRS